MHKLLKTQNFNNPKVLAISALFAAISFICGKFLAFSIGDTLRFSFENLPLILIGILFGPTIGAITAIIADIVGCLLRGYAINPILTFAAAFIGFFSGIIFDLLKKRKLSTRVILSVLFCHLFGSVLIKTVGLCIWYATPFWVTLLSRLINYTVVTAAELTVLIIILKSKPFCSQISKITGNNNGL